MSCGIWKFTLKEDMDVLHVLKPEQNGHYCAMSNTFFGKKSNILMQISLKCIPEGSIGNMLALVQTMCGAKQVTSHYPNQCWPSSVMPYDVTRPQWVNHYSYDYWCPGDTWSRGIVWHQVLYSDLTFSWIFWTMHGKLTSYHIDGWVQERHNPTAVRGDFCFRWSFILVSSVRAVSPTCWAGHSGHWIS